jgi:hypothetical protein
MMTVRRGRTLGMDDEGVEDVTYSHAGSMKDHGPAISSPRSGVQHIKTQLATTLSWLSRCVPLASQFCLQARPTYVVGWFDKACDGWSADANNAVKSNVVRLEHKNVKHGHD